MRRNYSGAIIFQKVYKKLDNIVHVQHFYTLIDTVIAFWLKDFTFLRCNGVFCSIIEYILSDMQAVYFDSTEAVYIVLMLIMSGCPELCMYKSSEHE